VCVCVRACVCVCMCVSLWARVGCKVQPGARRTQQGGAPSPHPHPSSCHPIKTIRLKTLSKLEQFNGTKAMKIRPTTPSAPISYTHDTPSLHTLTTHSPDFVRVLGQPPITPAPTLHARRCAGGAHWPGPAGAAAAGSRGATSTRAAAAAAHGGQAQSGGGDAPGVAALGAV